MFDILPIAEKQLYQIFVIEFHFYSEFVSYTLVQILAIQLRQFSFAWNEKVLYLLEELQVLLTANCLSLSFYFEQKRRLTHASLAPGFISLPWLPTKRRRSRVTSLRSLDQWEARAVRKLDRCFQTMLSCRTMRVYFGRKIGFFIDDRWWVSQKMSADIEGHITEKYEIKKRLGKGVSRGNIVNMLYTQQTTVASLAIVPAD